MIRFLSDFPPEWSGDRRRRIAAGSTTAMAELQLARAVDRLLPHTGDHEKRVLIELAGEELARIARQCPAMREQSAAAQRAAAEAIAYLAVFAGWPMEWLVAHGRPLTTEAIKRLRPDASTASTAIALGIIDMLDVGLAEAVGLAFIVHG